MDRLSTTSILPETFQGTRDEMTEQITLFWQLIRAPIVAPLLNMAIYICLVMFVMLFIERICMAVVIVLVKVFGKSPKKRYKWEPIKDDVEIGNNVYPMVLVQVPMYNEREVYQLSIGVAYGLSWPSDRIIVQDLVEMECQKCHSPFKHLKMTIFLAWLQRVSCNLCYGVPWSMEGGEMNSITPTNFCTFVESMPRQHLICFFGQIIHEIEEIRDIHDFHLNVKTTKPVSFAIEVLYGDHKEGPEKLVDDTHCISCNNETPLFPGVLGGGVCAGECVLKEFNDQPYVQCSLDAKARPGFIVTPLRHVGRLGELDENELYFLWSVGVRALRNEGFGGFVSMIVNHGNYRNLPHLHLKIWVDDGMHKRARVRWIESRRQLWARLELLTSCLPKKRALCVSF
eukprot:Gb_34853 [translate_table: standard]